MADTQTNTVILKVSLDEGQTEKQLAQLVLDIEATKKAQAALTAERKAGKLADEEFAAQAVKLKAELKAQQTEQTALTKNLDLYRTATGELGNTYKGVQAQLSLAQNQYKLLEGSQDTSSESAKALSATIDGLRGTLKATDEQQGLFVRNIGNYPKGESLEPLIQKIVQLEELQKAGVLTTQQAAQAEQAAIGFKQQFNQAAAAQGKTLQQAQNELKVYGEAVRPAVAELVKLESEQHKVAESAGKESKAYAEVGFKIGAARKEIQQVAPATELTASASEKAAAGLDKLSGTASKLPGQLGQTAGGLVETGKGLLSTAKAALALIATPLGAFLALITGAFLLLKSAFTSSEEGQNKYAKIMAVIGTLLGNLGDLAAALGEKLIAVFEHPLESVEKLGTFLKDQFINRFVGMLELLPKVGTAIGLLFRGEFAAAGKVAADAVGKVTLGVESVTESYKRASQAVRDFAKENLTEAQAAARVADQRAQADKIERGLLTERARVETQVAELQLKAREKEKFSAAERKAALLESQRLEEGLFDKEKKVLELRRDAQIVENTFSRTNKENLTKEEEAKAAVIRVDAQRADAQRANQRLLNTLNAELLAKQQAATKAAAEAAKQRAKDAVAAKQTENELALLEVRKGSAAELVLKQRGIDLAADMELAGEKKSIKQVELIRAKAEGDKLDLRLAFDTKEVEEAKKRTAAQNAEIKREYEEAAQLLTQYLDTKRAEVERAQAAGLISESEAQRQLNAIEKAGLAASLVNAKDYNQDKAKIIKSAADLEIKEAKRVADQKKRIEQSKQDVTQATLDAALETSDLIIQAVGEETAAGQAALAIKKVIALAEIGLNLEKQLSANAVAGAKISAEAPPYTVPLGIAYTIATDALAIAVAAGSAAKVLGFRDGGVLAGASHEQGGIPFTVNGRPGFEAEHNEVILARGVWENPLLRPLASTLNVLGGGKALLPRAHMAVGGVVSSQAAGLLRGDLPVVDPSALGLAVAAALRKNPPVTRWVDYEKAQARNTFTDTMANA